MVKTVVAVTSTEMKRGCAWFVCFFALFLACFLGEGGEYDDLRSSVIATAPCVDKRYLLMAQVGLHTSHLP